MNPITENLNNIEDLKKEIEELKKDVEHHKGHCRDLIPFYRKYCLDYALAQGRGFSPSIDLGPRVRSPMARDDSGL